MHRPRAIATGALAIVLLIALVIQQQRGKPPDTSAVSLEAIIPRGMPGWQSSDLPIADSREIQKQLDELLNYSGAVFREYRHADQAFLLYASYWNPGRMSPVQLAVHTPDNCWVSNGMIRQDRASRQIKSLGGAAVLPGELRVFAAAGREVRVAYWMTADGQAYTGIPDDHNHLFTALVVRTQFAWRAIKLQLKGSDPAARIYYVRVSTTGDLQALFDTPSLAPLWDAVRTLGLQAK